MKRVRGHARGAMFAAGAAASMAGMLMAPPSALAQGVAQANQSAVIDEIMVSARRREERLIDTPVAASVLGTEGLDRYNTRSLSQLTERIPGLDITESSGGGAGGNISIRGIGKPPGTADYGVDQPVSLVIDGMSFTRGHMLKTGFFDIAAVEVLKGPQALYFGKNSPAGVIAVTSITPEVGEPMQGFIRAQYEFETQDPVLEAGLSFPVSETVAMRVALRGQDMRDGWMKNNSQPLDVSALYLGEPFMSRGPSHSVWPQQEQFVGRLTTVWEPAHDFRATLRNFTSYTKRNDGGTTVLFACADGPGANPHYVVFPDPTQICPDNKPLTRGNASLPPAEVANANIGIDEDDRFFDKLKQQLHTLELEWDAGDYLVTLNSGFWDYEHEEYTNYDWTSYAVVVSKQGESGKSFTNELRLQSQFDGPVNFLVGAFYEKSERDLEAPVQILPSSFLPGISPYQAGQFQGDEIYDGTYINYHQLWNNDIRSWSVFASADWDFAERWRLSGGIRYTDEKRKTVGGNLFENGLGFSPSQVFYEPSNSADNWSPELTLSYHFTDDVMGYVSYKHGFQSGGISNPGTAADLRSLSPEARNDALTFDETTIEGFEVGLKGYFLDNRLRTDFAAFWYETKDLQVGIFNSNTTTFTIQNAAVAHNWGLEFQADYQLHERVQLRFAGQYNHLKFDEWEDAGCHPVDGALGDIGALPSQGPGCHIGPDGVPIQDLSGIRYGGPPLQANVGLTYFGPAFHGWDIIGNIDTIHHSKGKRMLNQPFTEVPSRTVTNIAATLGQQAGPWEVSLMCSNCFNKRYVTSIMNKPLAKIIPGERGDMTGQLAPPRLVTLSVTYSM